MKTLALLTAILASSLAHAEAQAPSPTLRRFALIVSSNDGGRDRPKLRFADSDGRSIAGVLRELGGLRAEDLVEVPNATRAALKASFASLQTRLAALPSSGPRREVVVYYSGHSDEEGLLLGSDRVSYSELRDWIHHTNAEVRIAILDSCASGALIRQKGGTRAASFLGDRSVDARGHAFLTASSADEAAQESDRLGAAFFTHYLVSGLRGAADTSRDGVITLGEAYQFAYQETLRRTENTSSGAQHPNYDIQLAGIGDLVLTDLRATSSSLTLDANIAGRVHVRDDAGRLVVELQKDARHPVTLGLAPGAYTVAVDDGGKRSSAAVTVRTAAPTRLAAASLAATGVQPTTSRGDVAPSADSERAGTLFSNLSWRKLGGYASMTWGYSQLAGLDGFNPSIELALRYRQLAVGVAGGAVITRSDDSGRAWTMGYGGLMARYHILFGDSPFYLSVAAVAAAGGLEESVDGTAMARVSEDSNVWLFEPKLGGHVNLTRWLRLGIDIGYRFIAAPNESADRDFNGVTGGFSMQAGWF